MRISTSQYLGMNVQAMDNQQSELSQLYAEISSGQALTTPASNPLGAAQAVQLSMQGATLSQYSTNQSSAQTSLESEDSTLTSVIQALQSVNTQLESAGGGTLNDTDRSGIAATLTQLNNQLVTLSNTTSPSGGYLFGGFQSSTQPFTQNSAGAVVYNGDNGVSSTQISSTTSIVTGDTGASVFLSVTPETATPVGYGSSSNTGTGVIGTISTSNGPTSAEGDTYSVAFQVTGGVTTYTVTDTNSTGTTTGTAQPYTSGSAIPLGTAGESVVISGTPDDGDTFNVAPATQVPAAQGGTNIFSTIQNMITALQTPADTTSALASLQNTLATGMAQVQNSINNVTSVQATVGGREQQITAMQAVNQTQTLANTNSLDDLTSVDMPSTISKYTQTQYSLQASQQAFVQVQQMSLFQYLNQ
ncbi:flagellar hook-associated protein FlgL [Paraburkholderia sp.]|jgi:flagellar hook-associated protein 3 FlgL|uniref:flagellar hook-associated protein FlgL n=1 Tax=Paraburkholderia sp. TaxID=1926495 RepID=UPI000EFD1574|nr:flagellar hook-associated protein FlgL [Paraburkholderia sp.]